MLVMNYEVMIVKQLESLQFSNVCRQLLRIINQLCKPETLAYTNLEFILMLFI